jgi:hypothetical protein
MSLKKKFTLEFPVHSSPSILFEFISEPNELLHWFADDVKHSGDLYTFVWDGEEHKAKLLSRKDGQSIKFKWVEDEPHCYFEIALIKDEITNDLGVLITDFATEDTIEERKSIWSTQIQQLIELIGAY